MNKIFNFLLLLSVLAFTASCISEIPWGNDNPNVKPGEAEVKLRLRTPGGFKAPAMRSLSFAQENAISDVYVLVFNSDNSALMDIKEGLVIDNGTVDPSSGIYSGTGEFSITLPQTMGNATVNLVVLANAGAILDATVGTDFATATLPATPNYDNVMRAIFTSITGKMFTAPGSVIPMWGETGQISIDPGASQSVELMRAIARIDVGVGFPSRASTDTTDDWTWNGEDAGGTEIPFVLQEVYVMRPNNRYAVAPAAANRTGTTINAPTVPAGTTAFSATDSETDFLFTGITTAAVGTGTWTARSIYVPEADINMNPLGGASMDDNHTERMAIVVGGSFNGNPTTYYRLDFAKGGSLIDVYRNFLYQFNIISVSGDGYGDPITAYESTAMNMEADILNWNDSDLDNIYFDGTNYFRISDQRIVFSPFVSEREVIIETNVSDFTLTMGNHTIRNNGVTVATPYYLYTITPNGGNSYTFTIAPRLPNVSPVQTNRLEEWGITAARLKAAFTVRQEWTRLYVSVVNGSSTTVFPEGVGAGREITSIPIAIVSQVPVTVEVVDAITGIPVNWVEGFGDLTDRDANNLYIGQLALTVQPYNWVSGTYDRAAIVKITPDNESTVEYTITQRRPILIVSEPAIRVQRPVPGGGITYPPIDVLTNLPLGDLSIDFNVGGTDFGDDAPNITSSGLSPIGDAMNARYQRFTISVSSAASPMLSSRVFSVLPPAGKYGDLQAATTTVTIPSEADVFDFFWNQSSFFGTPQWSPARYSDGTTGYLFPWNTTAITFDVVTSHQDPVVNTVNSTLHGGTLTLSPWDGTTYSPDNLPVYEGNFVMLNNTNFSSPVIFSFAFTAMDGATSKPLSMGFTRSNQVWGRVPTTESLAVPYTGLSTPQAYTITNNVTWGVTAASWVPATPANWVSVQLGTDGTPVTPAATPTAGTTRNDRVITETPGTAAALVRNTPFTIIVPAVPSGVATNLVTTTTGQARTVTVSFTNLDQNPDQGGSGISILNGSPIEVTQHLPVLFRSATTQPANGALGNSAQSFTLNLTSNLISANGTWGWELWDVTSTPSRLSFWNGTGGTGLNPVNPQSTVNITANNASDATARNLELRIFSTEFDYTEVIGTWTQARNEFNAGFADILYLHSNGTLRVGRWAEAVNGEEAVTSNNMVYAKFGGVIGFSITPTTLNATSIRFDPTTLAPTTYADIPNFIASDWNAGISNVSQTSGPLAYHTFTNIRAGKGDICMLVGLTATQARTMSQTELMQHDSGWRLPTSAENIAFAGVGANPWVAAGALWPAVTSGTRLPGVRLPRVAMGVNSGGTFLPAASSRGGTGNPHSGTGGRYWSSTPTNATNASGFFFDVSNFAPDNRNQYAFSNGYAIRCINR
ncbi:MAG: hypothetical protein LBI15_06725 [Dysgonamonadaceae bacterium]|jgi:hypothetical protein|nr:hypothetical protein [Dysgonamonadaceae bacterium]